MLDTDAITRRAERNKEYRKKNAERINEQRAKFRAANRESIRQRARASYLNTPEVHVVHTIKARAIKAGVPFNLTAEYVRSITPEYCPALGVKLERTSSKGGSLDYVPTVDRLIPELGYVKGNVIIVSHLANRIKTNATMEQLKAVVEFYENLFIAKETKND